MKKTLACGFALIVGLSAPLMAERVYIPVVDAQGVDGKSLATQLSVSNFDGVERPYSSVFLKSESDGTEVSGRGGQTVVPANQAVFFKRVAAAGEAGLLEIDAAPDMLVSSWIKTTRGQRTFYSGVPVITEQNRVAAGGFTYLNGVGRTGSRDVAQLSLVNLGETSSLCQVDAVDLDGAFVRNLGSFAVSSLSLSRFDDALGLRGEAATTLKVSCDQAFYAFAVAVDSASSEVSFLNPATAVEKATAPKAGKASVVFSQSGVFHVAVKEKPKSILRVPVPDSLRSGNLKAEFDFVAGPWNPRLPSGAHNLLFFHRGRFRGNTIANVNALGPKKDFLKINQNIDLPAKTNTSSKVAQSFVRGQTYHATVNYDASNKSVKLTLSQNGQVLRTLSLNGTARDRVLMVPASGLVAEFGNYNNQELPEVSSLGWTFSNFRVEIQIK